MSSYLRTSSEFCEQESKSKETDMIEIIILISAKVEQVRYKEEAVSEGYRFFQPAVQF